MSDQQTRYEYEFVDFGPRGGILYDAPDPEFWSLEEAIEEYASNGWRFVESTQKTAIFEKPVNHE